MRRGGGRQMREKEAAFLIPLKTFSRIRTRRPTWYPSKYIRPCRCDDEKTYGDKDDAPDERVTETGGKRKREGQRSREQARKIEEWSRSMVRWSKPRRRRTRAKPSLFHVSRGLAHATTFRRAGLDLGRVRAASGARNGARKRERETRV